MRRRSPAPSAALVLTLAAWASPPAEAVNQMARGVFLNGKVHYFTIGTDSKDQNVTHLAGTPVALSDGGFTWAADTTTKPLPVPGCADPTSLRTANAAVFGGKIVFAFPAWPGCSKGNGSHAYVVTFDPLTSTYGAVVDLGATHHKASGKNGDDTAVAVAVFDDLVYVFTDNGTFTSGNAADFTSYPGYPLSVSSHGADADMEPLGALSYFPPGDDPQLLVLYGKRVSSSSLVRSYNQLYAVHWNGQTDTTAAASIVELNSKSAFSEVWTASPFAGTVTPRNGNSFAAGSKAPSLQLFVEGSYQAYNGSFDGLRRFEYTYGPAGTNAWTLDPATLGSSSKWLYASRIFPWYVPECGNPGDVQRQVLASDDGNGNRLAFTSDVMIPQNRAPSIGSCSDFGGFGTATESVDDDEGNSLPAEDLEVYRKYWSLVGVVLGSPPFAVNGVTDPAEVGKLSTFEFGEDSVSEVESVTTSSNSVLVSAGRVVKGGFHSRSRPGTEVKPSAGIDFGFKHAWENEHGTTSRTSRSDSFTFGTEGADTEDPDSLGRFGWAIFSAPTISVQDYALYAYDWSAATGNGTALDQHLHSVQVLPGGTATLVKAFELADPGGPNDDIPGLMTGTFLNLGPSTQLALWHRSWQADSGPYVTVLGRGTGTDAKAAPLGFGSDIQSSVALSSTLSTVDASGESTSVDVDLGVGLKSVTKLKGFEKESESELKAGYAGEFGSTLTTTSELGTEVKATLGMHTCTGPDCIKTLEVQPFWLKAQDSTAPWIPDAFRQQLPWAVAWQASTGTSVGGARFGVSLPADEATGQVAGGRGGIAASVVRSARAESGYSVRGGRLAWVSPDGSERPIPMTADGFEPAAGVTLSLNGYTFSSRRADGKWKRQGDTWTFSTRKGVTHDAVSLSLDFGAATWSLDLGKALLSPHLRASEARAHVKLSVNDRYTFYFDCEHDLASSWELLLPAGPTDRVHLERYAGWYDTSRATGVATLEGTLPDALEHFGDVSIALNGHEVHVPLRLAGDLERAVALGRRLTHDAGGVRLVVDFGRKRWSARFSGAAFHERHAPRLGTARIAFLVGGEVKYAEAHEIGDYTSVLSSRSGARPSASLPPAAAATADGTED